MATSLKCSVGIALSLFAATSTFAAEPTLPRLGLPPIIVSGPGYGYGYLHGAGTTAHESINRGRGFLIRSVGERHLLDAEARRSLEEAIDRRLDNVLKAHHLRLERQRLGESERLRRYAQYQSRRELQMALNRADRIILSGHTGSAQLYETPAEARLRLAKSLLHSGDHAAAEKAFQQAEALLVNAPQVPEAPQ